MKNIFNIFNLYSFFKDNILYFLLVFNNCFKYKQSNDFLSENNQKIIIYNNCYICSKNLINNNIELEQENDKLINHPIYLAYDKIFCSPLCRNHFLSNI